jgi:hypothetical protein
MAEQRVQFIPTGPVPTVVLTGVVTMSDGNKKVQLICSTPIGMNTFFVEPDAADAVADNLKEAAREARTDIIVPKNGSKIADIRDKRKPR